MPLVALVALVSGLFLGACRSEARLPETPYIMLGAEGHAEFERVPASLRTPEIPVFYFTNRRDEQTEPGGQPRYGSERGAQVSFGVATVALAPEPTWDELVDASTSATRTRKYELRVTSVERRGGVGSLRGRLAIRDGQLVYPPEMSKEFLRDLQSFEDALAPWLRDGEKNDAIVLVHGVYNPFDRAVIRLAGAWHSAGRPGIPIVFSWPAGYEGFKPFAYGRDQESGDFSVSNLKLLLMALAMSDRVDHVHLIAHSRGAELAVTALREIHEEVLAALGQTTFSQLALRYERNRLVESPELLRATANVLKLESLLLVAADLDLEVFEQRFFAERVMNAAHRVVVYTSPKDQALSVADLFFESTRRLGEATPDDLDEPIRRLVPGLPSLEMIECDVKVRDTHAYLFDHPAALSDMIRVVRDDRPIGAEHGRPLEPIGDGFWLLDEAYLRPDAAAGWSSAP